MTGICSSKELWARSQAPRTSMSRRSRRSPPTLSSSSMGSTSRVAKAASKRDQPVSNPRLVDDQRGLRWLCLQLLPQCANGDAQIFGLTDVRRPPDGAQQHLVGQHTTWMLGEFGEQI